MAITPNAQGPGTEAVSSEHRSGSLADVLDVILDKGLVIDAFVRVSLVGIEILTVDARIVVASVDTYMHFAREAHRLEMGGGQGSAKQGLAGMMGKLAEGGAHSIGRGALQGAGEGLKEGLLPHRQKSDERGGVVQRAVGAIRNAISPDDQDEPQGQEQNQQARAPEPESRESAPESSPPARRSRRRQPAGENPGGGAGGSASPGVRASSGGSSRRRAAPSSRRAPSRDTRD